MICDKSTVVGWIKALKDVYVLILRACEVNIPCVTFHGQRHFAIMISQASPNGEIILNYLQETNVITRVLIRGRQEG